MNDAEFLKKWAETVKKDPLSVEEWSEVIGWSEIRQVSPESQKLRYNRYQYYYIIGGIVLVTICLAYIVYTLEPKPQIEEVPEDDSPDEEE